MDLNLRRGPHGFFLVDTGSYGSYVTRLGRRLLERAGATPIGGGGFVFAGASSSGRRLPETLFKFDRYADATMPSWSAGTIGLNLLSRYAVDLNFRSRTMRLLASSPVKQHQGNALLRRAYPLVLGKDRLYYAPARVSGTPVAMCVDTGSALTYVGGLEARRVPWPKAEFTIDGRFLSGTFPVTYYRIRKVSVAGQSIRGTFVVATVRSRSEDQSIVGLNVLRPLRLLLDFPQRKLYAW